MCLAQLPVSPDSLSVSYLLSRPFPLSKWRPASFFEFQGISLGFFFFGSEWGMIFFFFLKRKGISGTFHIDVFPPLIHMVAWQLYFLTGKS